ncbi:MAG: HAD-IA family hydrolase [Patescibacteria group bacterium]|jgi:phosphoglycolate phosphatase
MNPKKNLLIFDFDGVIVDTFSTSYSVAQQLDGVDSLEDFRAALDGNIFDYYKKRPHIDVNLQREKWFKIYGPKVLELMPVAGMVDLLTDLARQHVLTIVSSSSSDTISLFLEKYKFRELFEDVLGSNDHHSKVHKMNHIMNKFSITSEGALMITDTLGDIREAKVAGVESIAVSWGYHERERLLKGNPAALVHTPQELEKAISHFFDNNGK